MKDTIIKGSGNSRHLASVPNFLTLFPTYEAFGEALIKGELPIDLGHLNAAGLEQRGTDLGKATMLSDTTETALWGGAEDRTVDEAFAKLSALVKTAQSAADKAQSTAGAKAAVMTGSYTGSGGNKTISFPGPWHILAIAGERTYSGNVLHEDYLFFREFNTGIYLQINSTRYASLVVAVTSQSEKTITIGNTTSSYPNNSSGNYKWWAI